jgi:hypothetical protein
MIKTNTLAVVETATGLALVAYLRKNNIDFFIVEKQIQIAQTYRNHCDRLTLHTSNETMEKTCCISMVFVFPSAGILKKTEIEAKAIAYAIFKHKKA